MSTFRFHLATSLDGYLAGPNQSEENPLGEGGEQLHEWLVELEAWRKAHRKEGGEVSASSPVVEELQANVGAGVMGRNMFGPPIGGDWGDGSWRGWWGENPPFHYPVFVVTHHPREPLEMEGGTTFTFITEGVEAALERAREVAGDKDVLLNGGASVAQQALRAGLIDEFEVHVVPTLLGAGERLLENVGDLQVEQIRAVEAPGVTHLKYRVVK
jgi:dihydrofolate reductase